MKKLMLAAVAATFAVPAFAAPGNTATATDGSATAQIVAPIAITHVATESLNFGIIVPDSAASSVISITTGGVGSVASGGAVVVDASAQQADAFDVTGDANRSFSIATTAGTVSNGAQTMAFSTSFDTVAGSGTLDGAGTASFTVGGDLTVGAGQAAGTYTGSYSATVSYN
ncbi:DUF4402 domain-containing protein [Erythrobacter mangrovi]|uniref:DUF4402 domain-containing protein n=1 Tax=Erythrobacter mangrovi TaxID=2739433 RepID=A0A7D4BTG6_9SPHN|nr:DUF4402 domain-containing protein [Erythrobacter mangrovi]QKG70607.1 DUF4402 domain-containing protein [Erythrobacter mangrovi]